MGHILKGMRSCALSCQEIVCKWRDEFPENPAPKSTDNGKRLQQHQEAAEEQEEEQEEEEKEEELRSLAKISWNFVGVPNLWSL
jgi:hypothetical protein